jgi:hypothetical protein
MSPASSERWVVPLLPEPDPPLERRIPGDTDLRIFTPEVIPAGRHRVDPRRPGPRVSRHPRTGHPTLQPPTHPAHLLAAHDALEPVGPAHGPAADALVDHGPTAARGVRSADAPVAGQAGATIPTWAVGR